MTSALHSNGPNTSQERRESLPESNRKENFVRAASSSSSRPLQPLHSPIIVLSLSRCLSHQREGFWRTGGDCHHPNLDTRVLSRDGASEAVPVMSSRWQQFPTPSPTLPACGMETPNCPQGLQDPPKRPAFPSGLLYRNTAYSHVLTSLIPQTHFLCQPWEIH